jgi:hypothetical protein
VVSVLATVRWGAVLIGIACGALVATVAGLALWPVFDGLGVDYPPQAAITAGVILGLAASGYSAGRLTSIAHRFHGSVAGLGMAGVVLVVARLGGSPAPPLQVIWLALLGMVAGGAGGILGGRRRARAEG